MSHRFANLRKSFLKAAFPLTVIGLLAGCTTMPPRDSYVVFFQHDSVKLDDVGQQVVKQAADAALSMHASHVYVLGSAEKEGDSAQLKDLATTRALEVVELLELDGIDPNLISKDKVPLKDVDDSVLAYRRVSIKIAR
ncbi:OmpA family protein [Acetobacteraceae bacterium ESL0709]|nr:OmpA family protein [Acetobacteraceae bacterium ESL0697]MDF7678035.1 OmpA family protein [Acetobacteraceae bacterium ESL0709]